MNIKTFTVRGKMPFPLDMLRYDSCFPYSQGDVTAIADSLDRVRDEDNKPLVFEVTLIQSLAQEPTAERWESFMWKVV